MFRRRLTCLTKLRPSSTSPHCLHSPYDVHARKATTSKLTIRDLSSEPSPAAGARFYWHPFSAVHRWVKQRFRAACTTIPSAGPLFAGSYADTWLRSISHPLHPLPSSITHRIRYSQGRKMIEVPPITSPIIFFTGYRKLNTCKQPTSRVR